MHSSKPMKPILNRALRLVRVYHDLSQAEAARRVGLSKSYLSELEAGRKKVSLDVLEKYSSTFKVPVSSLMLFAEQSNHEGFSGDSRAYIADKALKILDWIAMVGQQDEMEGDINAD
jgi:transcriptional regulator with XRE-family HTH domain